MGGADGIGVGFAVGLGEGFPGSTEGAGVGYNGADVGFKGWAVGNDEG